MELGPKLIWPVAKAGYELVEIDLSVVDWGASDGDDGVVPPPDFEPSAQRAIMKWGRNLLPVGDEFGRPLGEYPITVLVEPIREATKDYQVWNDPNRFRELGNAEPTEQGVLGFANEFGLLNETRLNRREYTQPTTFMEMTAEISTIREALELWLTDKVPAAINLLDEKIGVTPMALRVGNENDQMSAWFEPEDLRSALRVQAILAMAGGAKVAKCPECPKVIIISQSARRPETTYCSGPCQMRAYRKRKKQGQKGVSK